MSDVPPTGPNESSPDESRPDESRPDEIESHEVLRDAAQGDPANLVAGPSDVEVERGELVDASPAEVANVGNVAEPDDGPEKNSVTEPAKVMRIGSMVKQLLEEVRQAPLDEASRERLAEVYERSVVELSGALSADLQDELQILTLPFDPDTVPSESELRVAQAQLVGWLEGLFHGIQATLFAQQVAARQQLEQMRQLPSGSDQHPSAPGQRLPPQSDSPGTYL